MKVPFDRARRRAIRRQLRVNRGLGQLRFGGAPGQEVAAEPEKDRLGSGGRRLRAPLSLDPEETGDEAGQGPGRLDQEPRARERVEGGRVARGRRAGGRRRRGILAVERFQEPAVEVRKAAARRGGPGN